MLLSDEKVLQRWFAVWTPKGIQMRPNPRYVEPPQDPDPRSRDGKKTVILHGRRMGTLSPKGRWPGSELWGIGRCQTFYWHYTLTDWDRWFDLHPVERSSYHKGIKVLRRDAWEWYCRQDRSRPIYLLEPHPDCPASVAFPRAWVQASLRTSRFTSSVEFLIALAICEGYQRIVLNGIGTRTEPDYQYAHKGILYWIGRAEGLGIEVVIDPPSVYCEPEKVYGYEAAAPSLGTDQTVVAADRGADVVPALSGTASPV